MTEGIAVALIGLGGSAIGSLIGTVINQKLTDYRLEKIEKKLEEHNKVVERTYKLEGQVANIERELSELRHA